MDAEKIIEELSKEYPGKNILKNPKNDPTEIICETEPPGNPGGKSMAVAVIDRSAPHYHGKTKETYKIIKGELTVYVDGKSYHLQNGEKIAILPGEIHYAVGKETWVEVVADPGWNIDDHFLID